MPKLTMSQATQSMVQRGTVSQAIASRLSQVDRAVSVATLKRGFEDPQMSCFVIDASPSMEPVRDAVIRGQNELVAVLRASAKCRKNALYVAQWLFSNDVRLLNPFEGLRQTGGDAVKLLDQASYDPSSGNGTALYLTVFQVLQDMAANIAYSLSQNIRATFTIGLITDGEDTWGQVPPDDIKAIVHELRERGYLNSSVLIGIDSPSLPREKIFATKDAIGFDEAVFVGQTASEIRRAFVLASQSALRA